MSLEPDHKRVYIGPEPDNGPHPGYRGPVTLDALGVHISDECEHLYIKDSFTYGWADSEWQSVGLAVLIPWHRVDAVEDIAPVAEHISTEGADPDA